MKPMNGRRSSKHLRWINLRQHVTKAPPHSGKLLSAFSYRPGRQRVQLVHEPWMGGLTGGE